MTTGWNIIRKAVAGIDSFTDKFGQLVSWCNLLLVIAVCLVVLLRYWFNIGSIALQELAMYMHALIFLGASSYTLKHNDHVRVDVIYNRMTVRQKALVNSLGTVLFLIPVCLLIGYTSWEYVAQAWAIQERSSDPGGLPIVYLLKSLILVFVITMILQGVAECLRSVMTLAGVETCHAEASHVQASHIEESHHG